MKSASLFLAALIALTPLSAHSTTWRVEQDGSGHFTQIQPALDAAASGDTVLIGPGEFTELIPSYIPGYAWDVEVCAYVHVPNLTIIGAGAGQTVLGPTTYQGSIQTFSPKGMVWLEGSERLVTGITFRNCYEGMHVTNGPLFVDYCEFQNNGGFGIIWHTEVSGGFVRNSQFSSNNYGSYGLGMLGMGENIIIENCIFDNSSINIQSIQGINFSYCEMMNSQVGIQISSGGICTISDCNIHDCSNFGISFASSQPHCNIFNSNISGGVAAVGSYGLATLFSTGTEFIGGSDSVFFLYNSGPIEIHNSHIFPSAPLAVHCIQTGVLGLVVHDLTDNYWGTTDPETVANWIWDQNDDPSIFAVVDFLPMADGPVPTEEKSFGSIKAMFR